ncbi:hypothetical protein OAB92_00335 [Candidatus Pelagibacter sp.]|nr:hypothetical protein [Candidatus Pelagibacter sp.]
MYGIYYSDKPSNEVSAQIKMGCAEYAMKAATGPRIKANVRSMY